MRTSFTLTIAFALILAANAVAQETRTEEIAAKQKERAAKSAPYQPSRFEKVMTRLEENFASPPNGFFPEFGSIYPGGGFTAGVGYRRFLPGTRSGMSAGSTPSRTTSRSRWARERPGTAREVDLRRAGRLARRAAGRILRQGMAERPCAGQLPSVARLRRVSRRPAADPVDAA